MKSFKDWFPISEVEDIYFDNYAVGIDQEIGVVVKVDNGMHLMYHQGIEPITEQQAQLIFDKIEDFLKADKENPVDEEEPYYPRYNHE